MKKLKLTQGKYALVDNDDYPLLSRHKWFAHKTRGGLIYVESTSFARGHIAYLHKVVLGQGKKEIDHLNRNPLDNRKSNLRFVTRSENLINRGRFINRRKSNKYAGIYDRWTHKRFDRVKHIKCRYMAQVHRENLKKNIGYYPTQLKAKIARDEYIKNL